MKLTSRSSGKGKLKLVILTFINRHFLVKKRLLLVEKLLFLFDARKTSFITTGTLLFLCTAVVCRQIMVAKTILVKCKAKKKARGDELTAGITCVI